MLVLLLSGCASLLTTLVEKGTLVEVLVGDLGFEELVRMDLTDEGELANQGVEPGDLVSVELMLTGAELVDYAVSQAITLRTEVEAERPDQDTELEARYVFRVQATLRGARNAAKDR